MNKQGYSRYPATDKDFMNAQSIQIGRISLSMPCPEISLQDEQFKVLGTDINFVKKHTIQSGLTPL